MSILSRRSHSHPLSGPALRVLLLTTALLTAAVPSASAQTHLGGFLTLDKRLSVGGDTTQIADFYNRIRVELSASPADELYVFASAEARFYDLPRVRRVLELEDPERTFPLDLMLWEVYTEIYGFLLEDLDLRLGKQRIAWGRADRLNPTDNLNPNDFSDPTRFYEKLPSWAARATYYAGPLRVTGVWMPALTPVLLPRGGADLFLGELATGGGTVDLPNPEPGNSMGALKIDGRTGDWDLSLSYFTGYDDVPVVRGVELGPTPEASRLDLGFPRMRVLGADFVTDVRGAGLWGEAALFFPEEIVTRTRLGPSVRETVTLEATPYPRFTLGGDYTMPGGLYANLQWMHGFATERSRGELHDYLVLGLEQEIQDDDVVLRLEGGWEVGSWDEVVSSSGLLLTPELTYRAIDNLEIQVGAFLVEGRAGTLFGRWQDLDQVYLRATVVF